MNARGTLLNPRNCAWLTALTCFAPLAAAITIRVPHDAPTIQAGIDMAVDGDVVLISPGVYTGAGNVDLDSRGKDIAIRGDGGADECIIDGQGAARGFLITSGGPATLLIESLTILNGFAAPTATGGPNGGGVYVADASLTLRGCIIESCRTADGESGDAPTPGGDGGGIFGLNASIALEGCLVRANVAGAGGNVTNHTLIPERGGHGGGVAARGGEIVLRDTEFKDNQAGDSGMDLDGGSHTDGGCGGALRIEGASVAIGRVLFARNAAGAGGGGGYDDNYQHRGAGGHGGAISVVDAGRLKVQSSDFVANHAGDGRDRSEEGDGGKGGSGGAIHASSMEALVVVRAHLSGNYAGGGGDAAGAGKGGDGGAISSAGTDVQLRRCEFSVNHAGDSGGLDGWGLSAATGGSGGAVHVAGAGLMARRTSLEYNRAGLAGSNYEVYGDGGSGGGLWVEGDATLKNCEIQRNRATDAGLGWMEGFNGGDGGGLCALGRVALRSCVLFYNVAGDGGSARHGIPGYGGRGGGVFAGSGATIFECQFNLNRAGQGGAAKEDDGGQGGLGGGLYSAGDATLDDCYFFVNCAGDGGAMHDYWMRGRMGDGGDGGAVHGVGSVLATDCRFRDNFSGYGGEPWYEDEEIGARGGHGAAVFAGAASTFFNCLIAGNRTGSGSGPVDEGRDGDGGGLHLPAGSTLQFCTLADNEAGDAGNAYDGGDGGGMVLASGVVSDCIFWNNDAASGDGEQIFGAPDLSFCDVMGGFAGVGNFDLDPLFATGAAGGYYLSQIAAGQDADSPCVDAGSGDAESFPELRGTTTRTDDRRDQGRVDVGFHAKSR